MSATVVDDPHTAVGEHGDLDMAAEAGEGLVDRVVDDLPHEVVQAAFTGRADVHTGALANRLEAFEDLNGAGVVLGVDLRAHVCLGRKHLLCFAAGDRLVRRVVVRGLVGHCAPSPCGACHGGADATRGRTSQIGVRGPREGGRS